MFPVWKALPSFSSISILVGVVFGVILGVILGVIFGVVFDAFVDAEPFPLDEAETDPIDALEPARFRFSRACAALAAIVGDATTRAQKRRSWTASAAIVDQCVLGGVRRGSGTRVW